MILNEVVGDCIGRIASIQRLKECYELRLHMLRNGYSNKTQYEKNEIDILDAETQNHIGRLTQKLQQAQTEFELTFADLLAKLDNEHQENSNLCSC